MKHSKLISENLSHSELTGQIKFLYNGVKFINMIPFSKRLFPKLTKLSEEMLVLKEQVDKIIAIPDHFNSLFSDLGWIAYESMKLETMEKAINLAETTTIDIAESFLTESYDNETLHWGITWTNSTEAFRCRQRLILLAKDDYLAGRYHACIPLLLALLDGISNDISKHVGIFSDASNMTVVDTIAAHPTGLQKLSKTFCSARKKTNHEKIYIPYRHGILHGRELNFDNKIVAAKCWAALFATSDWAKSVKKEPKEKIETSWRSIIDKRKKLNEQQALLNKWKARPSESLNHLPCSITSELLPIGSPEEAVFIFIHNWRNKNYGELSRQLLDYSNNLTKGKKIYHTKKQFSRSLPLSFNIISVDDEAPAISNVLVELCFKAENSLIAHTVNFRLVFHDSSNNALCRGAPSGSWKIVQNSFIPHFLT